MAQSQTAEQRNDRAPRYDPNSMPLPEPGVFGKIENALSWWNQPAEHKYTLGELFRKMTFQEPSQDGFHGSRIGRLAERIITVGLVIGVCASPLAGIGFFAGLIAAKVASVGVAGLVVMPLSKGLEGIARKLEHSVNKPADPDEFARKRGLVGGTEVKEAPVGMRNAHDIKNDPEDKIGASRIVNPDASIKQSFDGAAVDSRAFDPTRAAKPLATYGLGTGAPTNKAAAGGPGQKNGR